MSAEKITHENLASALAAFQRQLPKIGKDNTAQVRSDKGNYSYKYADLSDVSAVVLPALARHGLSFSSKPTLTDDGRFVLAYRLRHESGEDDAGIYPLPANGTPQQIGSALTYARRYVLSAVTGVAPDEDDDGQAAQNAYAHRSERRASPQRQEGNGRPAPSQPQEAAPPSNGSASAGAVQGALKFVQRAAERHGIPWEDVKVRYARQYEGEVIEDAADPNRLTAFAKLLLPAEATS